jgi:hypothetical protein
LKATVCVALAGAAACAAAPERSEIYSDDQALIVA